MRQYANELYNDGHRSCLSVSDLVTGDGIQANQFFITHGLLTAYHYRMPVSRRQKTG